MYQKIIYIIILILISTNCSKKEKLAYEPQDQINAYEVYEEGYKAFNRGDYFMQRRNFQKQN